MIVTLWLTVLDGTRYTERDGQLAEQLEAAGWRRWRA